MYKVAIVGSSAIARRHVRAMHHIGDLHLAAVCDIDTQRGLTFARDFGITFQEHYNTLLLNKEIGIIVICTPNWLHAPMAEAAIREGKHVLVEKPLALSAAEARKIIELSRNKGVRLGVVHQLRFFSHLQILKEVLLRQRLGMVNHFAFALHLNRNAEYFRTSPWKGQKDKDGGLLYNQAIHYLDLLNWFWGPLQVISSYLTTRGLAIETENLALSLLVNEQGTAGVFEASLAVYPRSLGCRLAIFAEKGTVIFSGKALEKIELWEASVPAPPMENETLGHEKLYLDFYRSLQDKNWDPVITGEEVLEVLELIESIWQSTPASANPLLEGFLQAQPEKYACKNYKQY